MIKKIKIGGFEVKNDNKIFLIAGPCVIESRDHALYHAKMIKQICYNRNNFDIQLENIYLQSAIILDFFNLLKKLEKKPDDTKLLQAIVELKKNLGLI